MDRSLTTRYSSEASPRSVIKKRMAGKDVTLEARAEKILAHRNTAFERRTQACEQRLNARLNTANRGVAEDAARAK